MTAPAGAARLLAGVRSDRPVALSEHVAMLGSLDVPRDVIDVVRTSGLRGRGGGGFPTGEKLAAVLQQRRRPVVIVNAVEGEPASKKDKALVTHVPHLVLDGAVAAARAVGARDVVVAVSRRGEPQRKALEAALAERREDLGWKLVRVADGFVAAEETAVIAAVEGRAAKPKTKPPYPFERGVRGTPTLVQNVETLAHLALVVRFGADWFRSVGTAREPGTALITLSGTVARPGIYEIELGTTLSELVEQAGGATEPLSAFLVGGYFGGWTRDATTRLQTSNGLGAGVVFAFPASACGVHDSARVARYLAEQSAGQCGPCVHGLAALAGGLEEIAGGRVPQNRVEQLRRWSGEVRGRGACRHPDGAARFITSALDVFEKEVDAHLRKGRCTGHDAALLPVGGAR